MSLASETIGVAAETAPKRPAKPPKPAKLISPSTSPVVPSHLEGKPLKHSQEVDGTNHHVIKDADQLAKPNSASNSAKPNVPPRGPLEVPSPTLTHQEPSSPTSSANSTTSILSETSHSPEKHTLTLDAPPSRRSNPPLDFITLPGTPGTEQDDPTSSPLHSPTAAVNAENKLKSAEPDSTASHALPAGTKATRPPPANAKDGRVLPARPKTLRRENRSASVAAPSTSDVIAPPIPLKLASSSNEIAAAAEIAEEKPVVEEQHFEVVLSANSPRPTVDPAEVEPVVEEKPEFDLSSPFGIEEMSESAPQNVLPKKAAVRVPLPPPTSKLASESRQQRSHSVSSFHEGKRIIPLPPQTTPAKVAPLVVPHISTSTVEPDIDKEEREKRAKKERKEHEKLERHDSDSSANNTSAIESNDKQSSSDSGPIPTISAPEAEKRNTNPDVSKPSDSGSAQLSKDKKEKEKDKEREKDREKEHSKGIFSKFTDKLKGKKQPKSDDESTKGVHFAEPQPSVLDSDEEGTMDPLLDRDPLTPAITPREGYMIESAMPTVTVTKPESNSDETSAEKTETASSSYSGDVSELEAHKVILKAQIKSMEEMHARLKATIAEEQQVLVDTRRSARSGGGGGRVTGHTKNRSNDTAGTAPLEVPKKAPSSAPNHKIFTSHRFASMAGFTLKSASDGNPESLLGFKQKISETSHGAVYACRHYQSGKMVSVRIVSLFEDTVKQLTRRMEEIKALDHENLARVLAVWPVAAELWLVTEYCPVGSLRTLLDSQCMHLQEPALASIAKSCLAALHCLHSANLHHGKLSLSNILIDSVGKVKICDYMLKDYLEPLTAVTDPKSTETASTPLTAAQEDIKSLGMAIVESIQGPLAADAVIDASWKLNKSESYSAELNAFLLACLTDPKPETTAEKLLQHPFITSATSNHVLIDVLADTLVKIRSRDGLFESSSHYPTRTRLEFDQAWAQASATRRKSSFLTLMPPTSASPMPPSVSISNTQKLEKLKGGLDTLMEEALKDASVETRVTIQHLKDSFTRLAEEALRE